MKTKYEWREDTAPLNTGSIHRKARLNLRLNCSTRARTHKVFSQIRKLTGIDKRKTGNSYADVWEEKILLALEHIVRRVKNGQTADRAFFMSLFDKIPSEDYERAQYLRLKERFERGDRRISKDEIRG